MARCLNLVGRVKLGVVEGKRLEIASARRAAITQARLQVVLVPHVHLQRHAGTAHNAIEPTSSPMHGCDDSPHRHRSGIMALLPVSRLGVRLKSIVCFTRTIETLGIETCLVLVDRNALHFTVPED